MLPDIRGDYGALSNQAIFSDSNPLRPARLIANGNRHVLYSVLMKPRENADAARDQHVALDDTRADHTECADADPIADTHVGRGEDCAK